MKPLISVVIPAYNAEKTVLTTIESVLNQTYLNFELIVINDGSTDHTLDLIHKIKDSRLKVHSFENAGLPSARNRGIKLASGEFVSFIDADDLWSPDKLESQIMALQGKPNAAVAYSWTLFIDGEGHLLKVVDTAFYEGDVYKQLLVGCFITSGSNVMIRKKYIDKVGLFDPGLRSAADWEYWIRLAKTWPFALVPRYQIFYRIHQGSMSHEVESVQDDILKVIDRVYLSVPYEYLPLKRKSMSTAFQYLASLYLLRETGLHWQKKAFKNFKTSIKYNPFTLLSKNTQYNLWTIILLKVLPSKLSKLIIGFIRKIKLSLIRSLNKEIEANLNQLIQKNRWSSEQLSEN
jgi:glycosyltransferase involved in cell wall biosynthesis